MNPLPFNGTVHALLFQQPQVSLLPSISEPLVYNPNTTTGYIGLFPISNAIFMSCCEAVEERLKLQ